LAEAVVAARQAADPSRPGRSGEDLACAHLESRGYAVLARNYRSRSGELDVVARTAGTTVFVEVKERRSASHGRGFESVTGPKRQRIVRAARQYAAAHGLLESPLRFDVISIDWQDGRPEIRHDEGAFDADGR
jgi:putative endonuclease